MGALHGVDGHFDLVPPPTPAGSGCRASSRIGIGITELAARRAGDATLRPPPVVTLSIDIQRRAGKLAARHKTCLAHLI